MNAVVTPLPVLYGPKILLMGDGGNGKTWSLGTAVEWALKNDTEVFVLFIENGLETLLGFWRDRGLEVPKNLHWRTLLTKPLGFKDLMDAQTKIGMLPYKAIAEMIDPNRSQNNYSYKILEACTNFTDDRTSEKFGAVDSWDTKRIFCIDSLTETANAFMKTVIGAKPTASQPDYGVAQNSLMNFMRLLTQALKCPLIMTAHVDKQLDPLTGGSKISVKSIGQAIASDIGPLFSDVIMATRVGNKFTWSTAEFGAATKTRSLGYKVDIEPDFGQILDLWQKRAVV